MILSHSFHITDVLDSRCRRVSQRKRRTAFTLIELLVVLFIFLLLASIALPVFRKLLSDQKTSKVARSIVSYIDEVRSRAVAQGRYVGIRIERIANTNDIEYGSAAAIRLRQLIGVPPYSGESADAHLTLSAPSASTGVAVISFLKQDNQLLALAGTGVTAPIRVNDLIELPGGRQFRLGTFTTTTDPITSSVNLNTPVSGANSFPSGAKNVNGGDYKYRIHRSPVLSSAAPLSFTRGIAIDLNYSGLGIRGNEFIPTLLTSPAINQPIDIIFGPDGRVESVSLDSIGNSGPPTGMIYLCLGKTDGVKDADAMPVELFSIEKRATANLMNLESIWIVINPNTGRVVVAPFASVSDTSSIGNAIVQARSLAQLSDTLDGEP